MKSEIVIICLTFTILAPIYAQTEPVIPKWIRDNAAWWSQGKISDQEFISAIQYLIDSDILQVKQDSSEVIKEFEKYKATSQNEINQLKTKVKETENMLDNLAISIVNENNGEYSLPRTTIYESNVYWEFEDSKQNRYEWVMPMETFEELVKFEPDKLFYYDEHEIPVEEFSPYVIGSFDQVIDDIYENSKNDDEFIQELWYITSHLTIYSTDIGENPRYALETLTRGGGDCEDTAILLADFLVSSQHTEDWDVWLIDMDSENPTDLQEINHVIVAVDIDKSDEYTDYFIETTTKDLNLAFNAYDYIDGYWFPVEKQT